MSESLVRCTMEKTIIYLFQYNVDNFTITKLSHPPRRLPERARPSKSHGKRTIYVQECVEETNNGIIERSEHSASNIKCECSVECVNVEGF